MHFDSRKMLVIKFSCMKNVLSAFFHQQKLKFEVKKIVLFLVANLLLCSNINFCEKKVLQAKFNFLCL